MTTPLVNALTNEYAHHIIALDSLARRLEESHARLVAALDSLLDKLEVMNGCNEHDMDGPEALPEFPNARAALHAARSLK